jgi:hypothetical protein
MHSIADMTVLAASAKTKVKSSARGWSMVTADEIIALAFIADLFLDDTGDAVIADARAPAAEPPVISHL